MAKLPSFQFYPGDWLRHEVAGCSLQAQGLWLRMLCVMHDCTPYGYLVQNGEQMPDKATASRCGTDIGNYRALLSELKDAGVLSYSAQGIIFSSRLVKDEIKRQIEREKKARQRVGGCPPPCPDVVPPDVPPTSPPSSSSSSTPISSHSCIGDPPESADGDDLDKKIRSYIGGHRMLEWSPKKHSITKQMVESGGWAGMVLAIDTAIAQGAAEPFSYAVKVMAGEQAQSRLKANKPKVTHGNTENGKPVQPRRPAPMLRPGQN